MKKIKLPIETIKNTIIGMVILLVLAVIVAGLSYLFIIYPTAGFIITGFSLLVLFGYFIGNTFLS